MGKNYKRLCDVPECMKEAEEIEGQLFSSNRYCKKHYAIKCAQAMGGV